MTLLNASDHNKLEKITKSFCLCGCLEIYHDDELSNGSSDRARVLPVDQFQTFDFEPDGSDFSGCRKELCMYVHTHLQKNIQ